MSPNNEFRVNARNFAITIPRPFGQESWDLIHFTKDDLLEHYKTLPGVKYVLVAREDHEDGEDHFHAKVSYQKKKDIRRSNFFNFHGCQANIQAAGPAWDNYCKKTGDFAESEEVEQIGIRQAAETLEYPEYLQWLHDNRVQHGIGKDMWKFIHEKTDLSIYEAGEGTESPELFNFRFEFSSRRSLVLVGRTGCGKTSWAKRCAPKPALFVRHIDQLQHFDPLKHKSIIFDDMDFKHWPRTAQIHITDLYDTTTINRRYGTATLPAGLPRIFTGNELPFTEDEAIRRRLQIYTIPN